MRDLGSFGSHGSRAQPVRILMDRRPDRAQRTTVVGKSYQAVQSGRRDAERIGSVFCGCKSPFESNFHRLR
jgi:hypothetical protein